MRVPLHVEQRHLTDHGPKELGVKRDHVAHQQPAVAATLDAQVPRCGDLAGDEILSHGSEVFKGTMTPLLQGRLMPAGAVLATATDVGHHIDSALGQPGQTCARVVVGCQRNLEATVAVEQRGIGAVQFQIRPGHFEIGDFGAILARGKVLCDLKAIGIEEGGQFLQFDGRLANGAVQKGGWCQVAARGHEVVVTFVRIHSFGRHGGVAGGTGQGLAGPTVLAGRHYDEGVLHIFQHVEDEVVPGPAVARQRRAQRRFEEHG